MRGYGLSSRLPKQRYQSVYGFQKVSQIFQIRQVDGHLHLLRCTKYLTLCCGAYNVWVADQGVFPIIKSMSISTPMTGYHDVFL